VFLRVLYLGLRASDFITLDICTVLRMILGHSPHGSWEVPLSSAPTHLIVHSILVHLLVETLCHLCCQFSKPVSESETHEVILCQVSTRSTIGFMQSSSHAFVLYNWLISSRSKQVGSTNLSPYDGSNDAMTLYYSYSKVILRIFKLIMA
jgi:hypothetical protein